MYEGEDVLDGQEEREGERRGLFVSCQRLQLSFTFPQVIREHVQRGREGGRIGENG